MAHSLESLPSGSQNCIRLMQMLLGSECRFALFDQSFRATWTTPQYTGPGEFSQLPDPEILERCDSLTALEVPAYPDCYLQNFSVYSETYSRAVIIQTATTLQDVDIERYDRLIKSVQVLVSEFDNLHSRMSANHEELQQLYYSCSQSRYQDGLKFDKFTNRLLKDCVESMGLQGVFLYCKRDKVFQYKVKHEKYFADTGLTGSKRNNLIQRDFYRLAETGNKAFLLEKSSQTGVNAEKNNLQHFQILVAPIFDHKQQSEGVLICVRHDSQPAFSRSDLRLAELMAERTWQNLQARYDQSSGFLIPSAFSGMLQHHLVESKKEGVHTSFLLIRVDRLDEAFALGGVEAGNHILSQVSALLARRVRARDLAGRLSKDEFGLLLTNCSTENAVLVADQIIESIAESTLEWLGKSVAVEANVGVVPIRPALVSADNLVRAGRVAVDQARSEGRSEVVVFAGSSDRKKEVSRISWEHRIYKAVVNSEFRVYCQPIEDQLTFNGGTSRYELLLRLDSADGVLVSPQVFISTARKLGLMRYVDKWMLRQAMQYSAVLNQDQRVPQYTFSINLSADSINSTFAGFVLKEAEKQGILAESICFDLTEASAMNNLRETNKFLGLLRRRGFEFALDDFGTGVGAYSSLRNISVDYVKINGALVKNMAVDAVSESIVSSLATVCRALGIRTIAESVETEDIREKLAKYRIDFYQGYQAGRPRAMVQEFPDLIEHQESRAG